MSEITFSVKSWRLPCLIVVSWRQGVSVVTKRRDEDPYCVSRLCLTREACLRSRRCAKRRSRHPSRVLMAHAAFDVDMKAYRICMFLQSEAYLSLRSEETRYCFHDALVSCTSSKVFSQKILLTTHNVVLISQLQFVPPRFEAYRSHKRVASSFLPRFA